MAENEGSCSIFDNLISLRHFNESSFGFRTNFNVPLGFFHSNGLLRFRIKGTVFSHRERFYS